MKRIHWKVRNSDPEEPNGYMSPALSDEDAARLVKSLKADPSVYEIEIEVMK